MLLLEAGGDEDSYDYQVPAFHARASEDERYAWNFFVRHYADDARQRRDQKFRSEENGVLYPRCATLGGCTAHNAMIVLYPHNSDWDNIAALTGDASWASDNMRRYFERLERCEYVSRLDAASRHGFDGWLATNVADPSLMVRDAFVQTLVKATLRESYATLGRPVSRVLGRLASNLDPNDWQLVQQSGEGVCVMPVSTHRGRRVGSREYVRRVQQACPIVSWCALTRWRRGYCWTERGAPPASSISQAVICTVRIRVTRQPLRRSGCMPRRNAKSSSAPARSTRLNSSCFPASVPAGAERHGIAVRLDMPGVGRNLQDRYEVTVVTRMRGNFSLIEGMRFSPPLPGEEPDPQFREWLKGTGPYTTNGAVVSMMKRSRPERPEPDLFIFGLLGSFSGYFPGYSRAIAKGEDYFTWAILKGHTGNTAGRVSLRSADPRDVPDVNFHYFDEGTGSLDDLASVVEGVETVRRITARCRDIIAEELVPGNDVRTPEQIRRYVEDNAWGHHASCSCRMGPREDPMAVVDSRFRVHGAHNLRVVDASVFPTIPGFFIASAVYMVSEKARDVIIEDAEAMASRAS